MGIQLWTCSGSSLSTFEPKALTINGDRTTAPVQLVFLFAFIVYFVEVDAVNLKQCGAGLQATRGTQDGPNTSPAPVLHLSYEECVAECGGGLGDVIWQGFSQSFGAWFLPWIALAFQIPFGAECTWCFDPSSSFRKLMRCSLDPLEDVLNFFMTIGSPALAAYSLQITQLNAGWLSKAFIDLNYPNSRAISTVVSAFQHVPIRISLAEGLLESLIVLPENDAYWERLLKGVKKTRRWTIPLIVGFVWVVFATLLTIVDSFHGPPAEDVGYSIVASWTYLLPLIMGWLHVGSQPEPNHLRECMEGANQVAWVATDRKDRPTRAKNSTGRQTQAIELMKNTDVDRVRMDELRTVPVFNYARTFIWSLHAQHILWLMKNIAERAELQIPVDSYGPGGGVMWVVGEGGGVANENRLGSKEQVIRYCTEPLTHFEEGLGTPGPAAPPSPMPSDGHTLNAPATPLPVYNPRHEVRRWSRWAAGVWKRVVLAVVFALSLQWGTVGAAVIIHYWKPPVGLGCRALSFLLYGAIGTLSMFFSLAASILAHISRPQDYPMRQLSLSQKYLGGVAVLCGYLGKALAFASGIGIMVICSFQSSGVYDNCYCASTTFDRGVHDVAFTINYTIGSGTISAWINGLVLAFSTAVLFGFSIYLGTPPCR